MTGQGQCSIVPTDTQKCQKCRLERCFAAGMRKDFLQTEEQKQKRRKALEENRNLTSQRLLTSESSQSSSAVEPQTIPNVESFPPVLNDIDNVCSSKKPFDEY